jgi:hypothetical protein
VGAAFDIGQNEYSPDNQLKLTAYRRSLSWSVIEKNYGKENK